jgi:hypothetical protein
VGARWPLPVMPRLGADPSPSEAPAAADAVASTARPASPSLFAFQATGVYALMGTSPSALIGPTRSADARSRTRDAAVPTPELPAPPGGPVGFGPAALSAAAGSSVALSLLLVAAITLAAATCRTSVAAAAAAWKPVAFVWLLERPG